MNGSSVRGSRIESGRALKGFTLIELLVVIAIIALLVSILLPSLKRAKVLTQQAVCASALRSGGLGLGMFESEHDGKAPPVQGANVPKEPWINSGLSAALVGGLYMTPSDKTLWCPAANDSMDRKGVFEYSYPAPPAAGPYDKTIVNARRQTVKYKSTYCVSAFLGWAQYPWSRQDETEYNRGTDAGLQLFAQLVARPGRRNASEIMSRPIMFDGYADAMVWDDGWSGSVTVPGRSYPRHGKNAVCALWGDSHVEFRTLSNPRAYNTMVKSLEWHPAKTADNFNDGYWTKYYY